MTGLRRSWLLLPAIALFWILLGAHPLRAAERILCFSAEGVVSEDSSLEVTESVALQAEGREIRRGIIRSIPTDFTDAGGQRRRAEFTLLSALLDGKPVESKIERVGSRLEIRLGDPEMELSPGGHVFTITYRTTGQLGFFPDHDELYWNVTGDEWIFPIDEASFRLRLPGNSFGEGFRTVEFYTGKKGEKGQDAQLLPEGSVRTTRVFPPGEGLTVVYTWPKGIVAPPAVPAPLIRRWSPSPWRAVHLTLPAMLLALLTAVWFLWGRDPVRNTIIPRFSPPPGIGPGFARYLRLGEMDNGAFAATVLAMAVKGFLTVEESAPAAMMKEAGGKKSSPSGMAVKLLTRLAGKSYRLRLKNSSMSGNSLTPDEQFLYSDLFAGRKEISLSDKDQPLLSGAFTSLEGFFRKMGKPLFSKNLWAWFSGVLLFEGYAVLMLIFMMLDIQKGGAARYEPIFALLAGPLLLLPFARSGGSGKGKYFLRILFPAILLFVTAGAVAAGSSSGLEVDPLSLAGPLAGVILLAIFKPLLGARTKEGAELAEEIEGLRMYMSTAEKHRLELLNPPEETPRLFEALLPWAFALDTAETWAQRFEGILADARYAPSWYRGASDDFMTSRSVAAFASGITAAVSSGTRSSGSDGSGSSGGGGGGGGGRGW